MTGQWSQSADCLQRNLLVQLSFNSSMALQLVGYIMSITGLCGLILGTFTNEWKIIGHDNDETVFFDEYIGLWMECKISTSSVVQCTSFSSLLHQACEYLSNDLWIHLLFDLLNRCALIVVVRCS